MSSSWTERSTFVPREESFLISKISYNERNSSEKKCTMQEEDWIKAKTSEAKTNSIVLLCREGRNSVLSYNFAHEFVPMKRPQESSSPNFLWRWKQARCLVSRHSVSVRQKILQVTPQNPESTRYSQVWTLEERSMNSECGSDQRTSGNRELRMVQKTLGNREVWKNFQPKQC